MRTITFVLLPSLLLRQCQPLSTIAARTKANRNYLQRRGRRNYSFYPEQVPSPALTPEKEERYLRIHQSFRRRRSFRRLVEITTIMAGQILRPLLCSLARDPLAATRNWDDFWTQEIRSRPVSIKKGIPLSNAQRVAEGFQQLGPTFVKLGQALSTRPDFLKNEHLGDALATLQDNMRPFDNLTAKRIIQQDLFQDNIKIKGVPWDTNAQKEFLNSLSDKPSAAASMAQVYKGHLKGYGEVAVKVQRPGIRRKVERDATLFHTLATWLQSRKWPRGTPKHGQPLFGSTKIVEAVDEFTHRIFEDMDFAREAENMKAFSHLYCHTRGTSKTVKVVVPELIPELCSNRVLVMEWINGTKLTDICEECEERAEVMAENLLLVEKAIECTLSQLLDTGLLHADPHTGNILKVRTSDGQTRLGYLDFGLVSSVPQRVRDGIVCAVVQVVFARNIEAVADLCAELEMLPQEKIDDPEERKKLIDALKHVFEDVLIWPKDEKGLSTEVPRVRFNKILDGLSNLADFEFTVPPYFLNNARALATLEGIGLKLDPSFNILRVIYPYSINRLMRNPSVSSIVEENFMDIIRSPETELFDPKRVSMLLNDWSLLTGYRKRKIFWDLATSTGARRVSRKIMKEWYANRRERLREKRRYSWWPRITRLLKL